MTFMQIIIVPRLKTAMVRCKFILITFTFVCLLIEYLYIIEGIHMRLIHPATQKHIDKFKKKELHIVDETYEIYKKITLPHIQSNNFSLQVRKIMK